MNHRLDWRSILVTCGASALVAATSSAGVRYTESLRSPGPGNTGVIETNRQVTIEGLMERCESSTHEEGTVGEAAGVHTERGIEIVRLDQGRLWQIDPTARTYTESTLPDLKQAMTDAARKLRDDSVVEAPDADVALDLKSTGQHQKIGPWEAERMILAVKTQARDNTKGQPLDALIRCDLWIAKGLPEELEIRDFEQNYLDVVGRSNELLLLPGLTTEYPKAFARALEALKGIPGLPVEWRWSIERQPTAVERGSMAEDREILKDLSSHDVKEDNSETDEDVNPTQNIEPGPFTVPDKSGDRASRDEARAEIPALAGSEDVTLPTKEGMITVMRLAGKIESIEAVAPDEHTFEVPPGMTRSKS